MATYVEIAKVEVGVLGATSIDFTSIPSTYTDLLLKYSTRLSTASGTWQAFGITFNNTTANRTQKFLFGTGSSAGSASDTAFYGQANANDSTANTFASGELYIPNYTGSNNKSVSIDQITENNATAALSYLTAGLWSDSAQINRITLDATAYSVASFLQYSTAYLYGIKKD